jgi:hypothetical protein
MINIPDRTGAETPWCTHWLLTRTESQPRELLWRVWPSIISPLDDTFPWWALDCVSLLVWQESIRFLINKQTKKNRIKKKKAGNKERKRKKILIDDFFFFSLFLFHFSYLFSYLFCFFWIESKKKKKVEANIPSVKVNGLQGAWWIYIFFSKIDRKRTKKRDKNIEIHQKLILIYLRPWLHHTLCGLLFDKKKRFKGLRTKKL